MLKRFFPYIFLTAVLAGLFAPFNIVDHFYYLLGVKNILLHGQWLPVVADVQNISKSIMDKPPLFFWFLAPFHFLTQKLPLEVSLRLPNITLAIALIFFLYKKFEKKPFAYYLLIILMTTSEFLTFTKGTRPDLLNLGLVIYANFLGFDILNNKKSIQNLGLLFLIYFLGIGVKGGTIIAFSAMPLLIYAGYLWLKTKNKTMPQQFILGHFIFLGVLAGGYLLLKQAWPQSIVTQTLKFSFESGRVNTDYLKLHFDPSKIHTLINIFFPFIFLFPVYRSYFQNRHETFDLFIKIWFVSALAIGFFLIQRADARAYFTLAFPFAYMMGTELQAYLKNKDQWKITAWFHWFLFGVLWLLIIFSKDAQVFIVNNLLIIPLLGLLMTYLISTVFFIYKKNQKWLTSMFLSVGLFLVVYFLVFPYYETKNNPDQWMVNEIVRLDRAGKLSGYHHIHYHPGFIERDRYGEIFDHVYFALRYLYEERFEIKIESNPAPSKGLEIGKSLTVY
jgi:hypothetical protein